MENTTASRLEASHRRQANRNQVGNERWCMHIGGCTNTDEETTQANQREKSERPPNGERLGFNTCVSLNAVGCRQSSTVKTYPGCQLRFVYRN